MATQIDEKSGPPKPHERIEHVGQSIPPGYCEHPRGATYGYVLPTNELGYDVAQIHFNGKYGRFAPVSMPRGAEPEQRAFIIREYLKAYDPNSDGVVAHRGRGYHDSHPERNPDEKSRREG